MGGWGELGGLLRDFPRRKRFSYEGGKSDRRMSGWLTSSSSQNALTFTYGPRLRDRSRQAVRDFPHANKALRALVVNLVGTGIVPQSATGDKGLDAFVEALFGRWAKECDTTGRLGFYGLQLVAARAFFESGEVIVRKRPRRMADGLPLPLQLQLLESDLIDGDKNEIRTRRTRDGKTVVMGRVVQGVEYDAIDRIRGYWLFRDHPGDTFGLGRSPLLESRFIPAADIAHLYEVLRPGQARGVPWFHAVLKRLWDFDSYQDARRLSARLAACHTATVTGGDPAAAFNGVDGVNPETKSDGTIREAFEPGLILHAPDGKQVDYHTPPPVQDEGFTATEQHGIAAGAHMPYALLTGDLSRVNFSSSRFGLMEFRRVIRPLQRHVFTPLFCDRIWRWFVDTAVAIGDLPARRAGYPVRWVPPLFEEVDRVKDAMADLLEMRAGIVSRQEVIRSKGRDPEQVLEEQQQDAEATDAAGLIWDSDPRRTAKSGQSQAPEPAEDGLSAGTPDDYVTAAAQAMAVGDRDRAEALLSRAQFQEAA